IIPDRELFQLPFELLLTTEADSPSSYKDLPYLLHQIQVQYDASATIWDLQVQRSAQSHNQKSLIFAYDGNVDSGYDLETEDEADMIQSLIGGAIFKGAQASKDQFRSISSEYGLLHLGCHAQLDDVNPQFSALYLAQNAAGDGKLSIQELSQSNLNAELAVLSACETGKGKYLDGEGLVSLTSGFLNAGVPAVVMSLWQVEDQSTQKLMGYFYQNLARGMDKDQALHEAKIQYLRLADPISAHPRFWAAFVAQGNMEPVSFLGSSSKLSYMLEQWYFWLIITLILGILAIYLGKRARNAKFSGIPE
ncbi:MAG: CHAT domain-containing protein, partial [Bacteroidia bacterium]